MKTGYSLLLGEYIDAEKISYVDCKSFQVVCPFCKEPVFKVNREATVKSIEYLSHYDKDKSYETECELRVNGLSKDEIAKTNNLARGQRLDYFLSVLREAILKTLYPQDETSQSKVKRLFERFNKSKPLKHYREVMFEYSRRAYSKMPDDELAEIIESYVDDIKEINEGEFYKTSFALETQKRIVRDVWRHLLSVKARENYFILFNHGYFTLMQRIELAGKERNLFEYEVVMYSAMGRLFNTSVAKGKLITKSLIEYPIGKPHAMNGSNLYNKLSSEIAHEMFGILLVLPYFELLKEAMVSEN